MTEEDTRRLAAGVLREQLRWHHPDGSRVFEARGRRPERLKTLRAWAAWAGNPSLGTVINWWCPTAAPLDLPGMPAPPPLPADAGSNPPRAMLRPDWTPRGDLVAIDHHAPGATSGLEVSARGVTWLGPTWRSSGVAKLREPATTTHWSTGAFADCVEWSFPDGRNVAVRTAVLLRSRGMALLGQQFQGPGAMDEIRLGLPPGIEARPDESTRALVLSAGKGKPTARLIPLGLPSAPYATERGSIAVEDGEIVIRQSSQGRRRWLAALVCWERPPSQWRALTVSCRSKPSKSDEAFAVRVAWGLKDEGMVIYRSLAGPDLRSFLGHQTRVRFLVGTFDRQGDVRPVLKLDAEAGGAG